MGVKYDKHYKESDRACGDPFKPFEDFVAGQPRPLLVLDLGCGQGRDALLFARNGHEVTGVDVSTVGIEQLQEIARREGLAIEAQVADIVSFVPDNAYDVVVLDRVLHMLATDSERKSVLDKACAATRPKGFILVSDYPKQQRLLQSYFQGRADWTPRLDTRGFLFVQRDDETAPACDT